MNKKIPLTEFITNHVKQIQKCAYLTHFELRDLIQNNSMPGEFTITTYFDYLYFNLEYNEKKLKVIYSKNALDEIISDICHEVAHIATSEFTEYLNIDNHPKKIAHYDERINELVSRWLRNSYKYYMELNKINIKTGLK